MDVNVNDNVLLLDTGRTYPAIATNASRNITAIEREMFWVIGTYYKRYKPINVYNRIVNTYKKTRVYSIKSYYDSNGELSRQKTLKWKVIYVSKAKLNNQHLFVIKSNENHILIIDGYGFKLI